MIIIISSWSCSSKAKSNITQSGNIWTAASRIGGRNKTEWDCRFSWSGIESNFWSYSWWI